MTRFFVDQVDGDRVCLGQADSHHLLHVMRGQLGQHFTVLCDGNQYDCRLVDTTEGVACGQVVGQSKAGGEPPILLTLFQGLAKGEKMESIIQHGTEIGVSRFVPVSSSRTMVKLEPKKAAVRVERWQRIAREAAEQSCRGRVPAVDGIASWKEAIAMGAKCDLALLPWEQGGEPLRVALASIPQAASIALFIGPEGGFSPEEVEMAKQHGIRPVTLGPRILRTETAALAAVAAILYALGDWG